ncbi:hypothetical protein JCM19301_1233 [Jejuia pallidilutea]|uniref:Uncharacterized protein n=1 Tax=Jejuia pallidilutea TaxID=504487 RepID=A0A090W643_9FLAO|nr:hypothetical protein JCM19301_1233 [Jejuia pallidilutea]GAL71718.1 hypothetical protein JCM19302_1868 [Jejuia pallidilutea]GAL91126.1 hypothetical protein JCM19538_2740 [Jejuia pallidilutea]
MINRLFSPKNEMLGFVTFLTLFLTEAKAYKNTTIPSRTIIFM